MRTLAILALALALALAACSDGLTVPPAPGPDAGRPPTEQPCAEPIPLKQSTANPCAYEIPAGTKCTFALYLDSVRVPKEFVHVSCGYAMAVVSGEFPDGCAIGASAVACLE